MEILKIDGAPRPYLILPDNEGKPLASGMTEGELRNYFNKNLKRHVPSLERKLMRANEKGCSSFEYNLRDFLEFNCAGPNGEYLSKEEIVKLYCSGV